MHARSIQEQYLAHNKKTVEKFAGYDPKLKCRFYNKVQIDPKAKELKKIINVKEKVVKTLDTKTVKRVKKDRKPRKTKPKVDKPEKILDVNGFSPKTNISKVYALYTEGLTPDEISEKLNLTRRNVLSKISTRKKQLGITRVNGEILKEVEKYYITGMKRKDIAKKMNRTPEAIAPYITEIRRNQANIKS